MTKRPRAAERDDISYTPKVGWLLAHNSVRATVDTRGGVNGFRRFWVPPDPKWKLCVRLAAGPRAALRHARREGGVIFRRRISGPRVKIERPSRDSPRAGSRRLP